MKKFIAVLMVGLFAIAGIALASTVTTTDGVNFNVTNDGGYTSVMSNSDITKKVTQFTKAYARDSQQLLSDQEELIVWKQVNQMATNAEATYKASLIPAPAPTPVPAPAPSCGLSGATCSQNTDCCSGTCNGTPGVNWTEGTCA